MKKLKCDLTYETLNWWQKFWIQIGLSCLWKHYFKQVYPQLKARDKSTEIYEAENYFPSDVVDIAEYVMQCCYENFAFGFKNFILLPNDNLELAFCFGWDIEIIEITMDIESKFKITIDDDKLNEMFEYNATFLDFLNYIDDLRKQK